jgi:hypothetical protein
MTDPLKQVAGYMGEAMGALKAAEQGMRQAARNAEAGASTAALIHILDGMADIIESEADRIMREMVRALKRGER